MSVQGEALSRSERPSPPGPHLFATLCLVSCYRPTRFKWLVVSTSPSWISARPGYLARPAICGKAVDLSVGIHGASPGLHRIAYTASCGLGWRRPVGRLHPGQAEVSAAGSNHCHIVADVTSFAESTIVVVP
jgi:hypothetical protein